MKNIFSLNDRRAVVVGGAGGIGEAIATGLSFHGAEVAIASRNLDSLSQAASRIKDETGSTIKVFQVDCTDIGSVDQLGGAVLAEMGGVDILVNSQGLNRKCPAMDMSADLWDSLFEVNVRGTMMCCKVFGRIMREKEYGKIINISSIRGLRAMKGEGNTPYATTKGAVDMLTRSLAGEWGQFNITVNAIAPILTETNMMKPILAAEPFMPAKIREATPLGRLAFPEDIVGPAVFLASDASAFVTGQIIYVDGGLATVA